MKKLLITCPNCLNSFHTYENETGYICHRCKVGFSHSNDENYIEVYDTIQEHDTSGNWDNIVKAFEDNN